MNADPYLTPAAYPQNAQHAGSLVSATAVEQLAATKPWVRFISVMAFIGAGFLLLGAAGMAVVGLLGGMAGSGFPAKAPTGQITAAMGFGIATIYVLLAMIYLYPGVKLWKYASAIASLIQTGRNEDLVAALDQQRSVWKYFGILLICVISIYLVAIIVGVLFAGLLASKLH